MPQFHNILYSVIGLLLGKYFNYNLFIIVFRYNNSCALNFILASKFPTKNEVVKLFNLVYYSHSLANLSIIRSVRFKNITSSTKLLSLVFEGGSNDLIKIVISKKPIPIWIGISLQLRLLVIKFNYSFLHFLLLRVKDVHLIIKNCR
jgi:hypothetical protein